MRTTRCYNLEVVSGGVVLIKAAVDQHLTSISDGRDTVCLTLIGGSNDIVMAAIPVSTTATSRLYDMN